MGKSIVEQAKENVKNKNKQENKSMKKPIIITVVLTLTFIASLAAMFVLGVNYNQSINDRVVTEAKALSQVAATPVKK